MDSYDYRGYIIKEDIEGYYVVDNCSFTTLDEACDWVDDLLESIESQQGPTCPTGKHTYHIFYVTKDYSSGYDEFIVARNENEAIRELRRMYPDIAYIADCYPID